jgi:hypothetical protein
MNCTILRHDWIVASLARFFSTGKMMFGGATFSGAQDVDGRDEARP